jgi:hypothetical protein
MEVALLFSSDVHLPCEVETLVERRPSFGTLVGDRPARSVPVSSWDIQASIVERR